MRSGNVATCSSLSLSLSLSARQVHRPPAIVTNSWFSVCVCVCVDECHGFYIHSFAPLYTVRRLIADNFQSKT